MNRQTIIAIRQTIIAMKIYFCLFSHKSTLVRLLVEQFCLLCTSFDGSGGCPRIWSFESFERSDLRSESLADNVVSEHSLVAQSCVMIGFRGSLSPGAPAEGLLKSIPNSRQVATVASGFHPSLRWEVELSLALAGGVAEVPEKVDQPRVLLVSVSSVNMLKEELTWEGDSQSPSVWVLMLQLLLPDIGLTLISMWLGCKEMFWLLSPSGVPFTRLESWEGFHTADTGEETVSTRNRDETIIRLWNIWTTLQKQKAW